MAAALAALFTRSQAIATREMADRDAARRHEERRPQWHSEVEATGTGVGAPHRLVVNLTSAEQVDEFRVVSLDAAILVFTDSQEGVPQLGDEALAVRPLRSGRRPGVAWRVLIPDPAPANATARMEITAKIGADTWTNVIEARLPTARN